MSTPVSNDGAGYDSPRSEVRQFRPRACQRCARSKLKCEWPDKPTSNTACNRCAKMKTGCVLPPLTDRKRRGPSTRVRNLEDKLEGIMSLLNAGGNCPPVTSQLQEQYGEPLQAQPDPQRRGLHPQAPTSPAATPDTPPIPANRPRQPEVGGIQIIPGFVLSPTEADAILNLYRTSYSPYFPFVPIPVTATAAELEQSSPLLFRIILQVVAPQTAAIQKDVDRWFRQTVAQRVVVEQERCLELLQALLVFIAWGDFRFYIESQATDLLHLASTLVLDLGLHQAPSPYGTGRQSFLPDAIRKLKGSANHGHTLEDMRAMLGFFYLNSVVSALFQRTGSSMFTSYLSHCCDVLLSAQEHDSDKFLVALVRTQRLLGHVADTFPDLESEDTSLLSFNGSVYMVMSTAQKELDALVRSQPSEIQRNVLLWTQYHGVLVRLYEPALRMRPAPRSHDPRKSTARTEALSRCLQALMDFFAAYANIPLDSLGHMPLVATAYMAFALVTSSRILMLNDADWDVGFARRTFDFAATCQELGDRCAQADSLAESLGCRRRFKEGDDSKSALAAYSAKLLWVRKWYLAKVAAGGSVGGVSASGMNVDHSISSYASLTTPIMSQELDQEFWSALLDPKSYSFNS